jgi:hypothetical protein
MWSWCFIILLGFLGTNAIKTYRDEPRLTYPGELALLLPLAVLLSLPLAINWSGTYSEMVLKFSGASASNQAVASFTLILLSCLMVVLLWVASYFSKILDEWLLEVSTSYGKSKTPQSVNTIGWFGMAMSLLALTISTFVPDFYSWQALLFTIVCAVAALAALNTSQRDRFVFLGFISSSLFYAIFLHGHLRNWWLT